MDKKNEGLGYEQKVEEIKVEQIRPEMYCDPNSPNAQTPEGAKKASKAAVKYGISDSISTLGPIGRIPFASGTFASLVALPLAFAFSFVYIKWFALFIVALAIIGFVAVGSLLRKIEETDPKYVVIDEVVGQLLIFLPILIFFPEFSRTWVVYALAFVFFRFFDIAKPLHVGMADKKLKGALGVMLDDVIAGIYAALLLSLVLVVHRLLI